MVMEMGEKCAADEDFSGDTLLILRQQIARSAGPGRSLVIRKVNNLTI
jgi:hypothetical protein